MALLSKAFKKALQVKLQLRKGRRRHLAFLGSEVAFDDRFECYLLLGFELGQSLDGINTEFNFRKSTPGYSPSIFQFYLPDVAKAFPALLVADPVLDGIASGFPAKPNGKTGQIIVPEEHFILTGRGA